MISVIVPVYKAENYLNECVDSILAQTYTDFELILVDDGSPDNCGAICDEYAARDGRIRVIHQKNGGLSAARNTGLDIAKGEYIAFVDSDDVVCKTYLECLLQALLAEQADISVCDKTEFWYDEMPRGEMRDTAENMQAMTGTEACSRVYRVGGGVSVVACCKLYKRALFETVRFPEGRIHEDQAVVPKLLYNSLKIVAVDASLYFYRQHSESIMRRRFSKKRFENLMSIDECIDFFAARNEMTICVQAKQYRERIIAELVLTAYENDAFEEVPEEYRMSKRQALHKLNCNVPHDYFTSWLGRLHPKMVRPYCYWHRLRELLKLERRK